MFEFLESSLQALACSLYGAGNDNLYDDATNTVIPPSAVFGPTRSSLGRVSDSIGRWACAAGPPPGTGGVPPTNQRPPLGRSGGWCAALYTMTVVWNYKIYPSGESTTNPPQGSAVLQVQGPITSFYTDSYPSPNLKARNAQGAVYNVNSISNDTLDYDRILSVSFVRNDGLPDNCQPGRDRPISPPVTLPDPRGPGLPPIIITPIAPIVIAPVTIFPRFIVDVGGIPVTINVNVNTGDISIGGPGELPPGCCSSPPDIDQPPPPELPDEPPLEEEYLTGVHTRATLSAEIKATEIIGSGADKSIFAPRLGSVSFLVRAGSLQSWTEDYDIKMQSQFFPVPAGLFATDYQVIEIPGVTVTVVPVYATVQVN